MKVPTKKFDKNIPLNINKIEVNHWVNQSNSEYTFFNRVQHLLRASNSALKMRGASIQCNGREFTRCNLELVSYLMLNYKGHKKLEIKKTNLDCICFFRTGWL